MDVLTKKQRKYCMSRIKDKNTKIEIILRKYIWNGGLKGYRLNNKICGKPDIYFRKKKIAIFIDGCFWHKCPKCFIEPKSNTAFWKNKMMKNSFRDKKINKFLKKEGIVVLRFWEHEINKNPIICFKKIKKHYDKCK